MQMKYKLLIPLILCIGMTTVAKAQKKKTKPNFLFILVDDLGWADINVNGSTFYETPNINKLASEGMSFTNAYVASSMCSPARASILTGKHPARLGLTNWIGAMQPHNYNWNTILRTAKYATHLPLEEVTIAESLKKGGYATHFIGKWHVGKPEKFWPEHQGFDTNIAGCAWGAPIGGEKYFSPYNNPRLPDGPDGEFLPDRLAAEAVKFFHQKHDKPFFTYLSFYSVHSPWIARKDLKEKYAKKTKEEDEWREERWIDFKLKQNNSTYAAMIEGMDTAIGSVLDGLKEAGLEENTIVIFISDNGGASEVTSNAPLRAGKCFLYEGGIRVPMLMKWPGKIKENTKTDTPIISTDFFPTMLEMANLPAEPKNHVDGYSFTSVLEGKEYERKELFWHYPHYEGGFEPATAIRSGKWKLIEFYEEKKVELYDLSADVGEYKNLVSKYPEEAEKLQKRIHEWRKEVNAAEPTPNPNFNPFESQNYRTNYVNLFKGVNQHDDKNQ